MATLVFTLAAAVAVPATTAAGTISATGLVTGLLFGAAGSYLDSKYLLPAVLGSETPEQGKLDNFETQTASEGAAGNFCIGSHAICAGTVVWWGPLQEFKENQSTGKGGANSDLLVYTYFRDFAIRICDGPIKGVRKIRCNGELIYEYVPEFNATNITVSAGFTHTSTTQYDVTTGLTKAYVYRYMWIQTDTNIGQFPFSNIKTGSKIIFSDFSASQINGEFMVVETEIKSDGSHYLKVLYEEGIVDETIFFPAPANVASSTGDIRQSNPSFKSSVVESIRIYRGTATQKPNWLIESYEGVGNVPAHRHSAYVVFKKYALRDTGNIIGNFEFEVDADGEAFTVRKAITKILTKYGNAQPGMIDVSGVTQGVPFLGMTVQGMQDVGAVLGTVLTAFDIVMRQDENKLVFYQRTQPRVYEVDSEKLAATEIDAQLNKTLRISGSTISKDSTQITVKFRDPFKDYEEGARKAKIRTVDNLVPEEVSFDFALYPDFAQEVALRILWDNRASNKKGTIFLPPSMSDIRAGDYIPLLEALTAEWNLSVERVSVGNSLLVEAEIREESLDALQQAAIVESDDGFNELSALNGTDTPPSAGPIPLAWTFLDIPGLYPEHRSNSGVYVAATSLDPNRLFKGAVLYESADNGRTYFPSLEIPSPAVIGTIIDITEFGGTSLGFDNHSYIEVELLYGELESVSTETSLAGANLGFAAGHVFSWTTATLTPRGTYVLTGLRHGLNGTEHRIDEMQVNDMFVLIEPRGVHFKQVNPTAVKTERLYKMVPANGSQELVTPVPFTIHSSTATEISPYAVTGQRDGSNNLTIKFLPRHSGPKRPTQAHRKIEDNDSFRIDILDGSDIARSYLIRGAAQFSYTAAMQTSDGLTPGDPVSGVIYTMHPVLGRGYPRKFLV